jgi:hypothetical protein
VAIVFSLKAGSPAAVASRGLDRHGHYDRIIANDLCATVGSAAQIAKCITWRVQKSAAFGDNNHAVWKLSRGTIRADEEATMAVARKDEHSSILGNRAFYGPVLWILVLLVAYFVLADWQAVPSLIASTFAAIH